MLAARAVPVVAILMLATGCRSEHRLELTTYFSEADGLRKGAAVRVVGVELGKVRSVQVRPELPGETVEVKMTLSFDYDLQLPSDAVARLETAGVLGETFVEIDIRGKSGPPVTSGAVLKSEPSEARVELLDMIRSVVKPCPEPDQGLKPTPEAGAKAPPS